ncbi:MAG: alpha/beta hydrolase [Bacteroidota bacterium]
MKKFLSKLIPRFYGFYFNVLSLFNRQKTAQKAFDVFCTIRKGRITDRQKPYLDSAKMTIENAAGHQVQLYHWPGKGDTVLLVHGWESNAFRWRNLIQKLQTSDLNIIAFDAPGHGNSSGHQLYVPLYSDCLQVLIEKYQPTSLVGHSVGGMTLLYNDYYHQNEGVEKMVTIGSPSEFKEIMANYQNILGFNGRVLAALDLYIQKRFNIRIKDFSSSRFVQNNTKKGLLFHDRFDAIAPYHASEQVHSHWKNSTLVSTEGLGHSMHQSEVNDKIVSFLAS